MKEADDGASICKTSVNEMRYGLCPSRLALVYIKAADQSAVYLDTKVSTIRKSTVQLGYSECKQTEPLFCER